MHAGGEERLQLAAGPRVEGRGPQAKSMAEGGQPFEPVVIALVEGDREGALGAQAR